MGSEHDIRFDHDYHQGLGFGHAILYDLNEDSDYYVGYAGSRISGATLADWGASENNADAKMRDGFVFDDATGLIYVPKKYTEKNKKGELKVASSRIQLLYATADKGAENSISVKISEDGVDGDVAENGTAKVDVLATDTKIVLAKDKAARESLKDSSIDSVIANGIEYTRDMDIDFTVEKTGEIQTAVMYDKPISIKGEIDKRQEIADPTHPYTEANGDGENNADTSTSDDGSYDYTLDFRSTSNTWTDEFTVEDDLYGVMTGKATLDSITTPQAYKDFDGKMNVWYKTDQTPSDYANESGANQTLSDGHSNPWLTVESNSETLGEDGRKIDYTGWKLWKADVSTTEAEDLKVSDLDLAEGEHVTAIRFEYGRVESGFTTREDDWDRDGIKDSHDDVNDATETAKGNSCRATWSKEHSAK